MIRAITMMDTGLLLGFGATIVTAILGSSVVTAWLTQRSQRPLTLAQARGEDADAAAVIMTASTEFITSVVSRVALLESKVLHLEQNQGRLVAQLVAAGIEPNLLPSPWPGA